MAGRIRSVKPQLFQHEGLNDLEAANPGLHVILTFIGLFTQADGEGLFEWKPRTLKLHILPFVEYDQAAALQKLCDAGHILYYKFEGKEYGKIINFTKHQRIVGKEFSAASKFPKPPVADGAPRPQRPEPQPVATPQPDTTEAAQIPPLQLIADHMADTLADLHDLTVVQVIDKAATEAQKFVDFYKNGKTKAGEAITDWEKLADIWITRVPKGKATAQKAKRPQQAKAAPQTTEKTKIKWREP